MRVPGDTRLAISVVVLVIAAGCGSAGLSIPPATVIPAITPPTAAPSTAGPVGTGSPAPAGTPALGVVMDPDLLGILPAAIGTAEVKIEPDAFADAIGDASFTASVDAAAFAVVVSGDDLASGVVAHLRPGAYSDAFYRDWRDSYDEGACGQAGGVARQAEVTLGGRPVYVTTCTGGLRVYHVYVPEREVIVSLFSLGEGRFGEQLLAGLRP